jgi:hypothetical protein
MCSPAPPSSPAGSACRSAPADPCAPPSCPTPRRRTRAPTPCGRRCSAGSTSCCTRPAGSRAGWCRAMRSSSSTPISSPCSSGSPQGNRSVARRPGARCHPRGRARQPLPRLRPHPGQFRGRVLALERRRQQFLRAMARRRRPGYRAARQRHLEAAAARLRGPAARREHRRGAHRLHGQAQGGAAGQRVVVSGSFEGRSRLLCQPGRNADKLPPEGSARWRPTLSSPREETINV